MLFQTTYSEEQEKLSTVSFKFNESFKSTFKAMIDSLDNSMDKLRMVDKIIEANNDDYGICSCIYKMRYITPSNVSAYVSYLEKAFGSKLLNTNVSDVELFTVAMVKEFMRENGCVPFESSSVIGNTKYVNPKTQTLKDLIMLCENDVMDTCVYSKYEMKKRAEFIKEDVKKLDDLHFPANMKKIVDKLPDIINGSSELKTWHPTARKMFLFFVEEFVLFACALNSINVFMMLSYALSRTSYHVTPKNQIDPNKLKNIADDLGPKVADFRKPCCTDFVTECCLLKTNNFVIRNKIPFNCNMRDIVLQDVHPNFKDTRSALVYVLTDDRSPIHALINKYGTKKMNLSYSRDKEIARMFVGRVNNTLDYATNNTYGDTHLDEEYEKVSFHTDVNWLDKIAFGNNYLDGNYRNDTNGNHHMHPIANTLEMVHRIFCGCDLKTNEEIADNIIEVSQTMLALINIYPNHQIENWHLLKDILCVLGDILTRNILKLYNNNTLVFSYDDQMDDTMIPGYLYSESFVMEDGEQQKQQQPSVTNNAPNTQTTMQKAQQKTSDVIKKFTQWVIKQVSSFSEKFNADHKLEVAWINKNKALNDQIAEALSNKKFTPTVNNFPMYNIPVEELNKINIDETVNKWLSSQDPIDNVAVKKSLYPGGEAVAGQIASIKNEAEEIAALSNYVLYKDTKAKAPYNGVLSQQLWEDLLNDLTNTGKVIDTITKKLSSDLKKACDILSRKAQEEERSENNNEGESNKSSDRANQLFTAVQAVSKNYYVTMLNTLRSKFYRNSYKLYSDIVKAYQQQNANNNSNAQNTQTAQQNQSNNQQQDSGQLPNPNTNPQNTNNTQTKEG